MGKIIQRLNARSKTFSTSAIAFLNTSLGLWALSSLGLGSITFLYTEFDALQKRDAAAVARITELQLEIVQRVEQYEAYRKYISINPEKFPSASLNDRQGQYQVVLSSLLSSPAFQETEGFRKPFSAAIPVYRDRTLASLVGELRVREIQRGSTQLPSLDAVIALNADFSSHLPAEDAARKVEDVFGTEYWAAVRSGKRR